MLFSPKGEPQTFQLKFKRAEDYPIDLYYLMDLSFSMEDDLENLKNLGTELMREMKTITSDFRIGNESFPNRCMRNSRKENLFYRVKRISLFSS